MDHGNHGGYKGIEICCSIYISPIFCISHMFFLVSPICWDTNSHMGYHMVLFFGNGCWMIRRYPNKIWMDRIVVPTNIQNEILVLDGVRFFWSHLQTAMVWNLVPLWQFKSTTGDAPLLCLLTSRFSSCQRERNWYKLGTKHWGTWLRKHRHQNKQNMWKKKKKHINKTCGKKKTRKPNISNSQNG